MRKSLWRAWICVVFLGALLSIPFLWPQHLTPQTLIAVDLPNELELYDRHAFVICGNANCALHGRIEMHLNRFLFMGCAACYQPFGTAARLFDLPDAIESHLYAYVHEGHARRVVINIAVFESQSLAFFAHSPLRQLQDLGFSRQKVSESERRLFQPSNVSRVYELRRDHERIPDGWIADHVLLVMWFGHGALTTETRRTYLAQALWQRLRYGHADRFRSTIIWTAVEPDRAATSRTLDEFFRQLTR